MLNGRGAVALAEDALESIDTQWAELKAEANQVRESLRAIEADKKEAIRSLAKAYLRTTSLEALDGEFGTDLLRCAEDQECRRAEARHELRTLESDRLHARLDDLQCDETFEKELHGYLSRMDALRDDLERFQFDAFIRLHAVRARASREPKLEAVWRFVTLGGSREDRWAAEIEATIEGVCAEEALELYSRLNREFEEVSSAVVRARRDRLDTQAFSARHRAVWELCHNFDECRLEALADVFCDRLGDEDPSLVGRTGSDDVLLHAAKLLTIDRKGLYLRDLLGSLDGEMRQRHRRSVELNDLIDSAREDPDGVVSPEKAIWLRSVADGCADLKDRMLTLSRALHHAVFEFDDYEAVTKQRAATSGGEVLVYDVLCKSTTEPLPPEEFVRAVIPEVDRFRKIEDSSC